MRSNTIAACFVLCASAVPGQVPATPDFDRALASSALVVIGRVVGNQVQIDEQLTGAPAGRRVALVDTSRLALHVRRPKAGMPTLMFLHRAAGGFLLAQYPGVQRRIGKTNATVLRSLVRLLDQVRRRPSKADGPSLIAWASRNAEPHPDLAAACLLALARRPDQALLLPSASRTVLLAMLRDPTCDARLRDGAARILTGSGDPAIAPTLLGLLGSGHAAGLGALAGRLLVAQKGTGAVPRLARVFDYAAPGAHAEIIRAIAATQTQAAERWLQEARRLGATRAVQQALGFVARR